MAKTYFEKLKDPRWQKKRLGILNMDSFTCQLCKSSENSLHVHHGYYQANTEPWEYEDNSLITLCESCHMSIESVRKNIIQIMGYLTPDELMTLESKVILIGDVYERMYGENG